MRRSPIGRLAGRSSAQHTWSAIAGLALAAVALAPAAPTSAASPAISLTVKYGTCNVYGATTNGGTLLVKLKAAGGDLLGSYTASMAPGAFSTCFLNQHIVGGQRVIAYLDGVKINQINVPALGLTANRVTDVITVAAPAGTHLDVTATECHPMGTCGAGYSKALVLPSDGTWSKDLSSTVDLNGSDHVALQWAGPKETRISFTLEVPHLEVWLNRVQLFGAGAPGRMASVTLKDKDGQTRGSFTTKVGRDGRFFETIRDAGNGVKVAYGDVVHSDIASDAVVKVNMTLVLLAAPTNALIGHCTANQRWQVRLQNPTQSYSYTGYGDTNGNGDFSMPISNVAQKTDWTAVATCTTPAGDRLIGAITFP